MNVRYRVELSQAERCELTAMLSKGKRAARKQAEGYPEAEAQQFAEQEASKSEANEEREHVQTHRLSGTFSA